MRKIYSLRTLSFIAALFLLTAHSTSLAQCNTNTSICNPGTAGPFTFVTPGNAVSTCLDFFGPNVGYIMLNITTSGPLNMLIDGNSSSGFLDVAVFNVPNGVSPCTAIQSNSNQLGCNYASNANGCNQFGNSFPCSSSVPAPNVTAGQTLMIIVENWSGSSSNFTLQLGPPPGAQTGPPNPAINPAGPFCLTAPQSQLTAINQGGVWSGPGVSSSGMFNPSAAGPGTHTITYSIGAAPCNSSSTTTVTVNAAGTLNVTPSTSICAGGSTTLTASGATSYSWSPATGLSATTGATVTASPSSTTTYTVTGTSSGCTATGTTTVTIGANPTVNVSSNSPICEGEDFMLTANTLPNATFNWTGPNGFTSTQQNPTITGVTPANAGSYTVQIAVNGCSNTGSTSLVINPNIYPVLTPAGPFCANAQPIVLTANIPGGIWSGPGITNSTMGTFDPALAEVGENEITYSLTGPCGGSTPMMILINPLPEINFTADRLTGCSPLTINFIDNSYPASQDVVWSFGDGNSSTGSASGVTNTYINVGCYDVTLTATANNCTSSQTLANFICVQPDPIAEFTSPDFTNSLFYPTFNFTNQSVGAAVYAWTFGDGTGSNEMNPSHTYEEVAGSYEVELLAISDAGCRDSVKNIVYVEEELIFFVPNAFTPDGDEYNNDFQPVFTSGFDPQSYTLVIYDRWGEALFESHNVNVGWDGTYGGSRCQAGTYPWTIRFKDTKSDKKFTRQGHVTIVK